MQIAAVLLEAQKELVLVSIPREMGINPRILRVLP